MSNVIKTFAIASLLMLLMNRCGSSNDITQESQSPDPWSLIEKELSKEQVINALGPPVWVGLSSDTGDFGAKDADTAYILYWRNPGFPVAAIHFDAQDRVRWNPAIGGDETYTHLFEPSASYRCDLPERVDICR